MCTLVALHRVVPRTQLVVVANRDEFLDRPAEKPALRATPSGTLLAPRDVTAGGTWLGINSNGVFAALTNVACEAPDSRRRSRGLLVMDALNAKSANEAAAALHALPADAYNPFNLFVADAASAHAFTYVDSVRAVDSGSGTYVVGNAALDAPQPSKVTGLRERLDATPAPDLDRVAAWCAEHESAGPRGPLDALCVHTPAYGTRSQTLLQVGEGGLEDSRSVFRYAEGAPCETPYEEFTPLLRDLGRSASGVQGVHVRSHR